MIGLTAEPWLIHFGKGYVQELEMRKLPSLLPEFQVKKRYMTQFTRLAPALSVFKATIDFLCNSCNQALLESKLGISALTTCHTKKL